MFTVFSSWQGTSPPSVQESQMEFEEEKETGSFSDIWDSVIASARERCPSIGNAIKKGALELRKLSQLHGWKVEEDRELWFSAQWVEELYYLDQVISQCAVKTWRETMETLVADALLLTVLRPQFCSSRGEQLEFSLFPLTSTLSLFEQLRKEANYLNHPQGRFFFLLEEQYSSLELKVRLQWLGLLCLNPAPRDYIRKSLLFQKFVKSPKAELWTLACSGSMEQNYLNTCVGVSFGQIILEHHSSVCSLIPLLFFWLDQLQKQLSHYSQGDVKDKKYIEERISYVRKDLVLLEEEVSKGLNRESLSVEELRDFVLRWCRLLEKFFLLNPVGSTAHPTLKPASNTWLFSVLLQVPVQLIKMAVGSSDNPPRALMRFKGANPYWIRSLLCGTYSSPVGLNQLEPFQEKLDSERELDRRIQDLWRMVKDMGGLVCASTAAGCPHGVTLKAQLDSESGERTFLVGDPVTQWFDRYTLAQMKNGLQEGSFQMTKAMSGRDHYG